MTAFITRMPAGIAGSYNRVGAGMTIEAGLLLSTALPIAFGVAVGIDATTGKYRGITTGDTAATVVGVLVRPYPTVNYGSLVAGADPLGAVAPSAIGVQNIMRRGYCMVTRGGTTDAAKGGLIYVRIATPAAGKPIGGFEAAADGANTVTLPGTWYWMGPSDSLGNSEIAVNL
jgi:hypothetical protein